MPKTGVKVKDSDYRRKKRAKISYMRKGGSYESWLEGRRNGTITV